ncbi:MAG: MlaD family protein [Alphaproteobacteria bacterium]
METRANYIAVGAFVLVLFFGLVGFTLWIAEFRTQTAYNSYDIYFTGSVSGLREGGPVSYRGVTVGEVEDIRIDPANVERIRVTVLIRDDTPIKTDTQASLQMQGLTGGSMVMLSGGTNEARPLTRTADERLPVIASTPSQLERLMDGAPALVESIGALVVQAQDILRPETREAFAETMQNLQIFSGMLAAQSPNIAQTIEDASVTLAELRQSSEAMGRLAAQVEKDLVQTIGTVNRVARSIDGAVVNLGADGQKVLQELRRTAATATAVARDVQRMVEENRGPVRDFTSTGLYELSAFVNELRQLVGGLSRVTTDIRRDPARFIFGSQQDGYEARQ